MDMVNVLIVELSLLFVHYMSLLNHNYNAYANGNDDDDDPMDKHNNYFEN